MKKVKKYGYYFIIVLFIITAIPYVLEFVYLLGESFLKMNLLPEPIWHYLDIYFYYEALPLRILITVAKFLILSILLLLFYRKSFSTATKILLAITPIISALGCISPYWISTIADPKMIVFIIISVICIAHIVATGVLLIKDKEEFEDI